MADDITLGITLKADGSGLVGAVRLSASELEKLGREARGSGRDMGTLQRGSELARQGMDRLRGAGRGLYNQLFSLKGLVATVGLGALAKSFLDAARTSENYRVRLEVLLGSVQEGNRLFQNMAEYAGRVPFEFEKIMGAATQLSGIMAGGVDEISAWMPLIGDLAAATGLGIDQTTEQVMRMLSAGAASADMFRERGVLAMLGFTSGVSYSAEETRRMLADSWTDTESRFRGTTAKLARTWDGTMTMLQDKWFTFRNQVMDAGLFDYLKALASTFNNDVGQAMEDNKALARAWADGAIDAIESVIKAADFLLRVWNKLLTGIKTLQLGFEAIQFSALSAYKSIGGPESEQELQQMVAQLEDERKRVSQDAVTQALYQSRIDALQVRDFSAIDESAKRMQELKTELDDLINLPHGGGFDAEDKIAAIRDRLNEAAQAAGNAKDGVAALEAERDRTARYSPDRAVEINDRFKQDSEALFDLIQNQREKANDEARRYLEAEAERQAQIMQKPFENAIEGIQSSFTDFFVNVFQGGINSFKDLAAGIKGIFVRLAAELATLQIIRPIVGGTLSAVGAGAMASSLGMGGGGLGGMGGGIGGGLGGLGGLPGMLGLAGGGLSTLGGLFGRNVTGIAGQSLGVIPGSLTSATLGSVLGAGGLGALGGGVLTGLLGMNQTGGSIGGGLGSAAGMMIGGPLGALAGGALGSLAGGLFGGGKSDSTQGISFRHGELSSFGFTGKKFDSRVRTAADQIGQQLQAAVAAMMDATGAEMNKAISVSVGNRDRSTISGGGRVIRTRQGDANAALQAALGIAVGNLRGGDNELTDILQRTFKQTGSVDQAISAVQAHEAAAQAQEAAAQAAEQLKTETDAWRQSLESALDPMAAVTIRFDEMRETAKRLGVGLADVNALHLQALQDMQSQTRGQLSSLLSEARSLFSFEQLGSFRDSLLTGSLSPLSARGRFDTSRSQLDELFRAAQGGDLEAGRQFQSLASQTLTLGRDVFASGPEFQQLFRDVNAQLGQIISQQQTQFETTFGPALELAVREAGQDQILQLQKTQTALVTELTEIKRELKKVNAR